VHAARTEWPAPAGCADTRDTLHLWTQVLGTPVTIRNRTAPTADFTAPKTTGTMTFRLKVTDAAGAPDLDDVAVTVSAQPK